MNIATWQDLFTFIGLPVTILGFVATLYYADIKKFSIPFSDKYSNLYGNYKMFSYSRERDSDGRSYANLIEWDVRISRRFFKVPGFTMIYDHGNPTRRRHYTGDVFIEGHRMFVRLKQKERAEDDRSAIVFETPPMNKIVIRAGFLCGFRDPVAPYCGVHVLCDSSISAEEARKVLGSKYELWYEDYDDRTDAVIREKSPSNQNRKRGSGDA